MNVQILCLKTLTFEHLNFISSSFSPSECLSQIVRIFIKVFQRFLDLRVGLMNKNITFLLWKHSVEVHQGSRGGALKNKLLKHKDVESGGAEGAAAPPGVKNSNYYCSN